MSRLVCADIGIELDHDENFICAAEDWPEEAPASGSVFLAPPWLDMQTIDVRSVSLSPGASA